MKPIALSLTNSKGTLSVYKSDDGRHPHWPAGTVVLDSSDNYYPMPLTPAEACELAAALVGAAGLDEKLPAVTYEERPMREGGVFLRLMDRNPILSAIAARRSLERGTIYYAAESHYVPACRYPDGSVVELVTVVEAVP